jgi:hypothetical protein
VAAGPFEDDPVVSEDAPWQLRILFDWLAIALRASGEHARLDGLMAGIGFFEPLELPWSDNAEDEFAITSGHQGRLDRTLDDHTAHE